MTRLIEELNTLHASYVDAINHAIESDDVELAAEMAAEYERDTLLLVADRDGRRLPTGSGSPLRRLAAHVAALRAA